MFFEKRLEVRISKEIEAKMNAVMNKYPERFENLSHLARSAIISFTNDLLHPLDRQRLQK